MKSETPAKSATAELRKLAGVTLKEAAEVAGVAVSTMWTVERGKAQLTKKQTDSLVEFYVRRLDGRSKRVIESLEVTA